MNHRSAVLEPMAKKRSTDGAGQPEEPKKTTTKVAPDLLKKANMVARYRDIDLYDYIERILRPAIERDFKEMVRHEHEAEDD